MKRKKTALLCLLISLFSLVIAGCNRTPGKEKSMHNIFVDYYNEDKKGDKRSIFYENGKFSFVNDELDDNNILDGRNGEFRYNRIELKNGYVLRYAETTNNDNLFGNRNNIKKDNDTEFSAVSSNRFLSIDKLQINWNEKSKEFVDSMKDTDCVDVTQKIKITKADKYILYYGMVCDNQGNSLIGMNCLFEYNGVVYNFIYGGNGNYEDIKIDGISFLS